MSFIKNIIRKAKPLILVTDLPSFKGNSKLSKVLSSRKFETDACVNKHLAESEAHDTRKLFAAAARETTKLKKHENADILVLRESEGNLNTCQKHIDQLEKLGHRAKLVEIHNKGKGYTTVDNYQDRTANLSRKNLVTKISIGPESTKKDIKEALIAVLTWFEMSTLSFKESKAEKKLAKQ